MLSNVRGAAPTTPSICAESHRNDGVYRNRFKAVNPSSVLACKVKVARHNSRSSIVALRNVDKSCPQRGGGDTCA